MGLMKQKLLGAWGELKGRLNRTAGAASADRDLEARGAGQETIGKVRRRGAEAIERGLGKAEGTVGKAEQKLDELTGKRPAGNYTVRDYRSR
jgi:uncharacterized protein YjbJ (UPF0337 family)